MKDHADILAGLENATLLKRGGQKAAYRVTHPKYGPAVVKVGHYASPTTLERARREVATLKDLVSTRYPRQFEFAVASGNRFVVVEEYIESAPLSACLHRFAVPKDALRFIRELTLALRLLWDRRIVHRDVKPDNVLVRPDGSPVVIDLGIARLLDEDSLTVTHAARGPCTPVYAAPEQLRNRKQAIGPRTDQYALGIILVQMMLNGLHPFDPAVVGRGDSIVHNILENRWVKPSSQSPSLQIAVDFAARLLGPEPHDRFRTPEILLAALDKTIGEAT